MKDIVQLKSLLTRINGTGYKSYQQIKGAYYHEKCIIYIDHVQADPYAPPSKIRIRVSMEKASFPSYLYEGIRVIPLEDVLARIIKENLKAQKRTIYGTGKSGDISIDAGKQQVLKRSAVVVNKEYVEARLEVGLPAAGRRIKANEAIDIFCRQIPDIVSKSMYMKSLNEEKLKEHVLIYEDQEYIRNQLTAHGLIAFVGNGSILPRRSGNSDEPLGADKAVRFMSPPQLEIELETKNHGKVKGMGIPAGVNLIVGGGYHGKTTLLKALERGVYNHIPGDGREWVITLENAVKIKAEDGRDIKKVDISYFMDNLPLGINTKEFSSENASGSTSQAANIMEAIEIGSKLLLLDEDTSATNFMIRDARMQQLIASDKEPIKPFIDRVAPLYKEYGISTVVVIGGAGDYLDVADKVIMLDEYKVFDITDTARHLAMEMKTARYIEPGGDLHINQRVVQKPIFQGPKEQYKIGAKGLSIVIVNKENVNLGSLDQLLDSSQTQAIAQAIRYINNYVDGDKTIKELVELVYTEMINNIEVISPYSPGKHPGRLAMPRKFEIAGCLNRMRSLSIK